MEVAGVLQEELLSAVRLLPRLAVAVVALLIAWMAGKLAARAVRGVLQRGRLGGPHQRLLERAAFWICLLIGLAFGLNVLGLQGVAAGMLAGGGLTAVVLGFAFREIGENMLAGLLLAISRPFDIGDFIKSGDHQGIVKGIDLRTTHIRTGDGRDVFLPNGQLINAPLENYTLDDLRRPSFSIGIDYGDDPIRALELMKEVITGMEDIETTPPPAAWIESFEGGWVQISAAFWINVEDQEVGYAGMRTDAMERVRQALRGAGYTLSCDTTTNLAVPAGVDLRKVS